MEHKKLNRIIGFAVFLVATIVYAMTVAPTTSYWDCGEFITCAYILGVPHPPGSPLFILLGRLFSMIPAWIINDVGLRVNIISVLVSALTVMFTYLIIVRLIREWRGIPETVEEKLNIYIAGVVGALGFAFTSSFWFNAVEAEVYAMSMFFTSIVVWLILVWLEKADEPAGMKIMLFIAYLMGLATGIHLLNILAIPTLFLIIYFKKADLNLKTFSLWSLGGAAAFGAIYPGIVKGIPWVLNQFSFLVLALLTLGLFAAIVWSVRNEKQVAALVLMGFMLVSLGYSTYSMIYIRSSMQPVINENNPDDPQRFVSYLNREQYGDWSITKRRAPVWEYQIKKMYIRYFGWQFIGTGNTLGPDNYIVETISLRGLMGLPFLVGLIGMIYHFKRDREKAFAVLVLFIMTGVAIVLYLNQENPQPRERDYAYVGSFFAFALWIGIGASAILEAAHNAFKQSTALRKVGVALTVLILILAVPFNLYSVNHHDHSRKGNYVAYDYSYNILQSCEPNAILFTNGDNDTFPLWFLQYVYGIRKDVRVVNLSLLNTDWYIKQLRDEEPKVPISFSDAQIDQLQALLWPEPKKIRIEVARKIVVDELQKKEDNTSLTVDKVPEKPAIEFELANTKNINGHPVILVQDRMVLNIIAANRFNRPVYFAVTVSPQNMLGLDNRKRNPKFKNYLRMDGLVFKVMPYGGPNNDFLAPEKMKTHLFEKFQYRNLNNPDVYYNNNIIGLLQNYRSAFLRLANYYQKKGSDYNEQALSVLDKMESEIPEKIIPLRNYQLSINFGRMYAELGRPEELERRIDHSLQLRGLQPIDKLFMAEYLVQYVHNDAKAESLAVDVLNTNPGEQRAYFWLVSFYNRTRQYQKGVDVMEKYLAINPNDKNAKNQLQALKALAAIQDSTKGQADGK